MAAQVQPDDAHHRVGITLAATGERRIELEVNAPRATHLIVVDSRPTILGELVRALELGALTDPGRLVRCVGQVVPGA